MISFESVIPDFTISNTFAKKPVGVISEQKFQLIQ